MLTFLNSMLPANIDLVNDINDKISEFQVMNGKSSYNYSYSK